VLSSLPACHKHFLQTAAVLFIYSNYVVGLSEALRLAGALKPTKARFIVIASLPQSFFAIRKCEATF
jgi:hypothetical protein